MLASLVTWLGLSLAVGHADVPASGVQLVGNGSLDQMRYEGAQKALGSFDLVDVAGQPFDRAFRLTTSRDPGNEWDIQVALTSNFDIAEGDVLLASFWMRCVDSMTGEGHSAFVFEQNHEPHEKAVHSRVGAAGQWVQRFVPFRADRDYPAGKAQIAFRGGFDRQSIEVGGFTLTKFPAGTPLDHLPQTLITYAGR